MASEQVLLPGQRALVVTSTSTETVISSATQCTHSGNNRCTNGLRVLIFSNHHPAIFTKITTFLHYTKTPPISRNTHLLSHLQISLSLNNGIYSRMCKHNSKDGNQEQGFGSSWGVEFHQWWRANAVVREWAFLKTKKLELSKRILIGTLRGGVHRAWENVRWPWSARGTMVSRGLID